MNETRYDITAIPPDDSPARKLNPPDIGMPMNPVQCQILQALLISRFGLKYHIESKEGPVYFLEKSKGGLTKAVKPTDPKDRGNVPKMVVVMYGGDDVTEQYPLKGRNTTIAYTARRLSDYLHHPVIDRTGIEGVFDFDIPGTNDLETDISTAIFGEVKEARRDHVLTGRQDGFAPCRRSLIDSAPHTPRENSARVPGNVPISAQDDHALRMQLAPRISRLPQLTQCRSLSGIPSATLSHDKLGARS